MCIPGVCWVIVWCCNYSVCGEKREEWRRERRGEGLIHRKGISTVPHGLGLLSGILCLIKKSRGMLGAPAEKTVSMSTNMHPYSPAQHTQNNTSTATHWAILGLTWLLCRYTLLTVFQCVSEEKMQRTDKEDNGKCVPWKRERRENNEIKIHFHKTAPCLLQHETWRDSGKERTNTL